MRVLHLISFGLFWVVGTLACGSSSPPKAESQGALSCTEPQNELVLTAVSPSYRANIKRLAKQGVVAVKFETKGCSTYLRVLSNCTGKGQYDFTYEPGSDGWTARDTQGLYGRLPLGAADLSGRIQQRQVIRSQWEQTGVDALPPNTIYQRDMLEGAECAEATHIVGQIYLGGFTLASGEESRLSAEARIFGIGVGGERVQGVEVLQTSGTPDACEQAKKERKKIEGCDTPLKLGLLPLTERQPTNVTPRPTEIPATKGPATTPQPTTLAPVCVQSNRRFQLEFVNNTQWAILPKGAIVFCTHPSSLIQIKVNGAEVSAIRPNSTIMLGASLDASCFHESAYKNHLCRLTRLEFDAYSLEGIAATGGTALWMGKWLPQAPFRSGIGDVAFVPHEGRPLQGVLAPTPQSFQR